MLENAKDTKDIRKWWVNFDEYPYGNHTIDSAEDGKPTVLASDVWEIKSARRPGSEFWQMPEKIRSGSFSLAHIEIWRIQVDFGGSHTLKLSGHQKIR